MACTIIGPTSNAIVVAMLLGVHTGKSPQAASVDCSTLDAASAASVLGVAKAKSLPF